jgi:sec-independent protein translocase protein TatA
MGSMSMWHWIVVIGVVLLLFGRGKISELMGDVASGIKAFKKGMSDEESPRIEPVKTESVKTEPVRTLDHQAAADAANSAAKTRAEA